ncbi:MAG: FAD-dependent oxidoreductase [Bacteroidota bacterium]|nr:FAD-dependent oxidoreductase [Bacteroidota bacterium]
MEKRKPIAIIGAGIAGLTAANYLRKQNEPFILFEASDKIAGLAASFTDADGFSNDFGAHFITNRLAKAVGILDECILVKHYGEAIWLKEKSYAYPFGLIAIPRLVIGFLKRKLKFARPDKEAASAKEWFRNRYGYAFSDEVALPLIEAWSGAPAEDLAPAVGSSLPESIFKTFYLKVASVVTRRAVACGYNREMPEKASVWHVYPRGGVSTLCKKLAEGLEESIRLQSPVREIVTENNEVVAVKVNGETIPVSAVISTAPANILAKMVSGTDALKDFSKFRFRPMIFVNLKLDGTNILPDTVLWFPEKKYPFFRLTEVTRSMPWLAPKGKSIITVDIGCEKDGEFWNMDEAALTEICLQHLETTFPGFREKLIGSNVIRTTVAYPIFLKQYEKERLEFEKSTGVDNLISIGRNGEFAHRFMEDIYWRTQKKIKHFLEPKKEAAASQAAKQRRSEKHEFDNGYQPSV